MSQRPILKSDEKFGQSGIIPFPQNYYLDRIKLCSMHNKEIPNINEEAPNIDEDEGVGVTSHTPRIYFS
jgi:hypothetical protein